MEIILDHNQKIAIKRNGSKSIVRIQEKNGVYWLTYPRLEEEKEFLHGFSTRLGGVSKEHLYSMNLSFARGDREENVRENFQRIAHAVGFEAEKMVFTHLSFFGSLYHIVYINIGHYFLEKNNEVHKILRK